MPLMALIQVLHADFGVKKEDRVLPQLPLIPTKTILSWPDSRNVAEGAINAETGGDIAIDNSLQNVITAEELLRAALNDADSAENFARRMLAASLVNYV